MKINLRFSRDEWVNYVLKQFGGFTQEELDKFPLTQKEESLSKLVREPDFPKKIAGLANSGGIHARGLASEGYMGGYRDALNDIVLVMNDVPRTEIVGGLPPESGDSGSNPGLLRNSCRR